MPNSFISATRRFLQFVIFALVFTPASLTWADQLHLKNGDVINGELLDIKDGYLRWQSDILGELKIDQGHIAGIDSDKRVEVKISSGVLDQCWMYRENNRQLLHCDQGVTNLSSWKMVVAMGEPEPEDLVEVMEHKGSVVVALEDSSGNTERERYELEGSAEWRKEAIRHTVAVEYDNEKTDGRETKDEWDLGYVYDVFVTDQFFWSARSAYKENAFQDIDHRIELGVGAGYELINTKFIHLSGTAGVDYVDEERSDGENRDATVLRLGLEAKWKPTVDGIEVYHSSETFQSFETSSDYQFESKTGVSFPINGHLKSVLEYEWDYRNDPAEGRDKVDRKWSLGLKYDW